MGGTLEKALVLTVLRHAEDFLWRVQDIGLLSLRLDDRRQYRLHVWDASDGSPEPPVHDHPYDFTSTVIVGELTNTRYVEDPAGEEYVRFRYSPPAEDRRRSDTVRLSATATTFTEGDHYSQLAPELHASSQLPGTVTAVRCSWVEAPDLTVCLRDAGSWRSGHARDATRDEIKAVVSNALEWF
jgi:hypothetical protein